MPCEKHGLPQNDYAKRLLLEQEAAWRRTFTHWPHNCHFVGEFCVDCGKPETVPPGTHG
jgi:hypothetical protein